MKARAKRAVSGVLVSLALTVLVGVLAYDAYVSAVEDDAVGYYAARPEMLAVPVAVALVAGLAAWRYSRQSAGGQRRLVPAMWAAGGVVAACWGAWLIYAAVALAWIEASETGRTVAANAGTVHLKYVCGALGALFLAGASASLYRVIMTRTKTGQDTGE